MRESYTDYYIRRTATSARWVLLRWFSRWCFRCSHRITREHCLRYTQRLTLMNSREYICADCCRFDATGAVDIERTVRELQLYRKRFSVDPSILAD